MTMAAIVATVAALSFAGGAALGGFVGCAAMAYQHGRKLGQMEGEYRAQMRVMLIRVQEYASCDLRTPREAETVRLVQDLLVENGQYTR